MERIVIVSEKNGIRNITFLYRVIEIELCVRYENRFNKALALKKHVLCHSIIPAFKCAVSAKSSSQKLKSSLESLSHPVFCRILNLYRSFTKNLGNADLRRQKLLQTMQCQS